MSSSSKYTWHISSNDFGAREFFRKCPRTFLRWCHDYVHCPQMFPQISKRTGQAILKVNGEVNGEWTTCSCQQSIQGPAWICPRSSCPGKAFWGRLLGVIGDLRGHMTDFKACNRDLCKHEKCGCWVIWTKLSTKMPLSNVSWWGWVPTDWCGIVLMLMSIVSRLAATN